MSISPTKKKEDVAVAKPTIADWRKLGLGEDFFDGPTPSDDGKTHFGMLHSTFCESYTKPAKFPPRDSRIARILEGEESGEGTSEEEMNYFLGADRDDGAESTDDEDLWRDRPRKAGAPFGAQEVWEEDELEQGAAPAAGEEGAGGEESSSPAAASASAVEQNLPDPGTVADGEGGAASLTASAAAPSVGASAASPPSPTAGAASPARTNRGATSPTEKNIAIRRKKKVVQNPIKTLPKLKFELPTRPNDEYLSEPKLAVLIFCFCECCHVLVVAHTPVFYDRRRPADLFECGLPLQSTNFYDHPFAPPFIPSTGLQNPHLDCGRAVHLLLFRQDCAVPDAVGARAPRSRARCRGSG